ncbi:MAG: hypothetical protein ACJZ9K_02195 [Alphaproteobacteria bacterium]
MVLVLAAPNWGGENLGLMPLATGEPGNLHCNGVLWQLVEGHRVDS